MQDTAWVKGMKRKVEEELARKELEVVAYWKGEVEKILFKRPESLASFHTETQNLVRRMENRIKILKQSLPR